MTTPVDRKLMGFVWTTIAAGIGVLAHEVSRIRWDDLAGGHPTLFLAFAVLLVGAECRPIVWLASQDGGQATASWTFAFALVYLAPPAGALLSMAFACMVSELLVAKPFVRKAFNTAQVTVSLYLGAMAFHATRDMDIASPRPVTLRWVAAALLGCLVAFTVNSLFACVVLALHKQRPVWAVIRSAIGVNLTMDGLLLALAPVSVVVGLRSLVLLPLLLATVWAIFKSALLAQSNRHEATHDLLTSIPNRRYFDEQAELAIQAARRRNQRVAFLHVDLDGFKGINDRLGHHTGDLVLKEVSVRLSSIKRASDVVARLGGDEFALLLANVGSVEDAARSAERFLSELCKPLLIEGVPLHVGGSFGVALFPDHGEDADTLLRNADTAMYRAKVANGGVQVFDGEELNAVGRLDLVNELDAALGESELFLVYQPQIDLNTNAVVGVEALLRWQHPKRGLVLPGQFMPLAEQTELMGRVTEQVIRLAAKQVSGWRRAGVPVRVAVNASARNLHDLRFPALVRALLDEAGVDPAWIEVEITENTVTADPARSATVLGQLRSLGVRLSIDDFGTGYSSLAILRTLPFDSVKVDRSFVRDMATRSDDMSIVRSIIDLAHNLGMTVVAEGVEDPEVLRMLRELGCDRAQGYLIGHPVRASELDVASLFSAARGAAPPELLESPTFVF